VEHVIVEDGIVGFYEVLCEGSSQQMDIVFVMLCMPDIHISKQAKIFFEPVVTNLKLLINHKPSISSNSLI